MEGIAKVDGDNVIMKKTDLENALKRMKIRACDEKRELMKWYIVGQMDFMTNILKLFESLDG